MNVRSVSIPLVILTLVLTGCGGSESPTESSSMDDSGAKSAATPDAMPLSASTPGAAVFVISPTNGSTVGSPVSVKFGISGMTVAPAGQFDDHSGHHHLLIDTALKNPDQPIPSDAGHRHFGKGQTETTIELDPGQHTLQLVLGDGNHVPHKPPVMSEIVTITVE